MSAFKVILIKREELHKAEWNYKTDNQDMARKLKENIKENGILQASIIYENKEGKLVVLDGNHRLDAYNELGIDEVPCIKLGKISLSRAKRIAIEINETKFDSDPVKLAETIKDISMDFPLEELEITLPYSIEELENMKNLLDFDWGGDNNEKEYDENIGTMNECPKCGYKW